MKHFRTSCCVFFLAAALFCSAKVCSQAEDTAESTVQVSEWECELLLNETKLTGRYTGMLRDGLPEGEGVFEADEDNGLDVSQITGAFSAGNVNGSVTVLYKDGTSAAGKCKHGMMQGTFTLTLDSETWQKINYSAGEPVGRTRVYNDEGVMRQDWYLDGELISELVENAVQYDTEAYYIENYEYYGDAVWVEGEVIDIGEQDGMYVVKLMSSDNQKYFAVYKSGSYDRTFPAVIPSIDVGDQLTVYGYFDGIVSNNYKFDRDDYGFSFPRLKIFFAEAAGSNFNVFSDVKETYTYEDILENPNCYAGDKISIKGKVDNLFIDYTSALVYFKIKVDETECYVVRGSLEEMEENGLPLIGDTVKVKGKLSGMYRQTGVDFNGTEKASFFPYITSAEFR